MQQICWLPQTKYHAFRVKYFEHIKNLKGLSQDCFSAACRYIGGHLQGKGRKYGDCW